MRLPRYNVALWCRVSNEGDALVAAILDKVAVAPYESTVEQGVRDIHWGFEEAADALRFAEELLEHAGSRNVLKLAVSSASATPALRRVYKDISARPAV